MSIENTGPGGVATSYGTRSTVPPPRMSDAGFLKPEYTGFSMTGSREASIDLSPYLALYVNPSEAFIAAASAANAMMSDGEYGRVIVDNQYRTIVTSAPLVIPSNAGNQTWKHLNIIPTGEIADWISTEANAVAFFNKYETVSGEGKTWSLRKPLLQIDAGNSGLQVLDLYIDGKGEETARLAAGVRVLGNTPDRKIKGGKASNVETYGIFIGHDMQNSAQIDIEEFEIKPNSRTSRFDRTAYGIASGGNDMHWKSLVISNCHCPLLMGDSGSTTMMIDCDLFNGGQFDLGGFHHRLVEYHGNSNSYLGGRSGNGIWHVWNPDIEIGPTKFGVTEGTDSGNPPPSAFIFYATEANQDLTGWIQLLSETPIDLVTDIQWYSFEEDGGTWAIGTAQLETLKGHIIASGRGKYFEVQLADTNLIKTYVGSLANSVVCVRDATTNERVGFGANANSLTFWAGDAARWQVKSNKHLTPITDNDTNLGSASERIRLAYINAFPALNPAPTLANNEFGFQRISNTQLRISMQGSDGIVRSTTLTLA